MSSENERRDEGGQVSRAERADRGARWNRGDGPYVDAQHLTDVGTQVYEAVATLEYSGRSVTRAEVMVTQPAWTTPRSARSSMRSPSGAC